MNAFNNEIFIEFIRSSDKSPDFGGKNFERLFCLSNLSFFDLVKFSGDSSSLLRLATRSKYDCRILSST